MKFKPKPLKIKYIQQLRINIAVFDYYSGIQYCVEKNIPYLGRDGEAYKRMLKGEGYAISEKSLFDRVVVIVSNNEFPNIERNLYFLNFYT